MVFFYKFVLVAALLLASACSHKPPPSPSSVGSEGAQIASATGVDNVWQQERRRLQIALQSTEALGDAVAHLLDAPNEQNHAAAKVAWFTTMHNLEQSALLRFIGPGASSPFNAITATYQKLTSWPIEAGFLDGFGQHPTSGIVFDLSVPLTEEELRNQHQRTAANEASLGIYAVGVMLFGAENKRSADEFQPQYTLTHGHRSDGYQSPAELPNSRRRALLKLQVALLNKDLNELSQLFDATEPDSPATHFRAMPPEQREALWRTAAAAMLVEQLLAVGQHQSSANPIPQLKEHLWNNQLLARRLSAQLMGLSNSAEFLSDQNDPTKLTEQALQAVAALQPLINDETTTDRQWQEIYRNLRELARTFHEGTEHAPDNY